MPAGPIRIGITYRGRHGRSVAETAGDGPPAWLAEYSRDFDLIELGCTFDRLLSKEDATAWVAATPAGFTIDVQAFRALTRHLVRRALIPLALHPSLRRDRDPVHPTDLLGVGRYDLWERFRRSLDPLRASGRLGTIVLRFPSSFAPDLAGQAFLAILAERLPGDRLAVELPRSWFAPDAAPATVALLAELGIGAVTSFDPGATVTTSALPVGSVAAVRVAAGPAPSRASLKRWIERAASGQSRDGATTSGAFRVLLSGARPAASATARRLRAALPGATSPVPEPTG